jgi:MoxR-like ATPase
MPSKFLVVKVNKDYRKPADFGIIPEYAEFGSLNNSSDTDTRHEGPILESSQDSKYKAGWSKIPISDMTLEDKRKAYLQAIAENPTLLDRIAGDEYGIKVSTTKLDIGDASDPDINSTGNHFRESDFGLGGLAAEPVNVFDTSEEVETYLTSTEAMSETARKINRVSLVSNDEGTTATHYMVIAYDPEKLPTSADLTDEQKGDLGFHVLLGGGPQSPMLDDDHGGVGETYHYWKYKPTDTEWKDADGEDVFDEKGNLAASKSPADLTENFAGAPPFMLTTSGNMKADVSKDIDSLRNVLSPDADRHSRPWVSNREKMLLFQMLMNGYADDAIDSEKPAREAKGKSDSMSGKKSERMVDTYENISHNKENLVDREIRLPSTASIAKISDGNEGGGAIEWKGGPRHQSIGGSPKYSDEGLSYAEKYLRKLQDDEKNQESGERFWQSESGFKSDDYASKAAKIWGARVDNDELKAMVNDSTKHKRALMIWGPPGIGKSQAIQQVVDEIQSEEGLSSLGNLKSKFEMRDLRLSQLDDVDLRGIPTIDKGDKDKDTEGQKGQKIKTVFAQPSFLPTEGEGILFLDEVNQAKKSVQNAAFQLVLDRQLGDYKVPEGWTIVAAGNRPQDLGAFGNKEDDGSLGTMAFSAALSNRFRHVVLKIPSAEEGKGWMNWAGSGDDTLRTQKSRDKGFDIVSLPEGDFDKFTRYEIEIDEEDKDNPKSLEERTHKTVDDGKLFDAEKIGKHKQTAQSKSGDALKEVNIALGETKASEITTDERRVAFTGNKAAYKIDERIYEFIAKNPEFLYAMDDKNMDDSDEEDIKGTVIPGTKIPKYLLDKGITNVDYDESPDYPDVLTKADAYYPEKSTLMGLGIDGQPDLYAKRSSYVNFGDSKDEYKQYKDDYEVSAYVANPEDEDSVNTGVSVDLNSLREAGKAYQYFSGSELSEDEKAFPSPRQWEFLSDSITDMPKREYLPVGTVIKDKDGKLKEIIKKSEYDMMNSSKQEDYHEYGKFWATVYNGKEKPVLVQNRAEDKKALRRKSVASTGLVAGSSFYEDVTSGDYWKKTPAGQALGYPEFDEASPFSYDMTTANIDSEGVLRDSLRDTGKAMIEYAIKNGKEEQLTRNFIALLGRRKDDVAIGEEGKKKTIGEKDAKGGWTIGSGIINFNSKTMLSAFIIEMDRLRKDGKKTSQEIGRIVNEYDDLTEDFSVMTNPTMDPSTSRRNKTDKKLRKTKLM